jgi:hypothetical protein
MTIASRVVALDGHDGAGKSTLAHALAQHVGGAYVRPFHGDVGAALLHAGAAGNLDRLIALGEQAIQTAVNAAVTECPIVLDRGWMTVASLCSAEQLTSFAVRWRVWMPTMLCWADLHTTLARLSARDEYAADVASHQHYLQVYRGLAEWSRSPIIRTDVESPQQCLARLSDWIGSVIAVRPS